MAERDAFGREKGEDSLSEMGWRTGTPAWRPPPPAPVTAADPPAAPPPPGPTVAAPPTAQSIPEYVRSAPQRARPGAGAAPRSAQSARRAPRPRGPSLARLLIPLAVLGVIALGVGGAVNAGRDAVDGLKLPTAAPPASVPAGLAPSSLFRPAPLRTALAKLPKGRLVNLRVAADRIDAQLLDGRTRHITLVYYDGRVTDVKAPAGGEQPTLEPDTAAPARMIRTAARRAGRPTSDVDYLVLSNGDWQLFFKDGGAHYSANAAGRKVKKIG